MSKRREQSAPESKSVVSTTLLAVPASTLLFQLRECVGSRVVP